MLGNLKSEIKEVSDKYIRYTVEDLIHGCNITIEEVRLKVPLLHSGDCNNYILLCDLYWQTEIEDVRYSGIVPKGFSTDLASVPTLVSNIFARDGIVVRSAIVHDDLYATERFSRQTSDRIFYQLMKQDGVSRFTSALYYQAVKALGGEVWNRHSPESIRKARAIHNYDGNPFFTANNEHL